MRGLFLLPILLLIGTSPQEPAPNSEKSPVEVVSSKWFHDRQIGDGAGSPEQTGPPAITAADRTIEKPRPVNGPEGDRTPKSDTIDARGAELDRIVQRSRQPEPVDGFSYQVKVQNGSEKPVQNIFWEYQFTDPANPSNVATRLFVCNAKIKPGQTRALQAFTVSGPTAVVDVRSSGKDPAGQFQGTAIIDRVEYADGTFWQRRNWNLDGSKINSEAHAQSRNAPLCRSL